MKSFKLPENLKNRKVKIFWNNHDDWHYFILCDFDNKKEVMALQGVYDPEIDAQYDGDIFLANYNEVTTIDFLK